MKNIFSQICEEFMSGLNFAKQLCNSNLVLEMLYGNAVC